MEDRPYELKEYIAARNREVIQGNYADYKPTYPAELEEVEQKCLELYEKGQKIVQGVTPEDQQRCRKLRELRVGNAYGMNDLVRTRIGGVQVLVPAYMAHLEELRKIQEFLT